MLKGPRVKRGLPRPVSPDEAVALAGDIAETAREEWIGARDWAVLLLLYGAGLRIGEAMALTGAVLPLGETLRVTGKRGKTRIVPLLPQVRKAMEAYVALCPFGQERSEEHTSELQSPMRISYAVFCLNNKNIYIRT